MYKKRVMYKGIMTLFKNMPLSANTIMENCHVLRNGKMTSRGNSGMEK